MKIFTQLGRSATLLLLLGGVPTFAMGGAQQAAQEIEKALHLVPNKENGRRVYELCAVCHQPEGWGRADGYYPQIAGQLPSVTIKQLADIRAGNRDAPTMLPFTMLETLSLQQIADVAAYIAELPMTSNNGTGPGTDLLHGQRLYQGYCGDCHEAGGEGNAVEFMPRIQGQHYAYLVRQFLWVRQGKRVNGDPEMRQQIQGFTDRDLSAVLDYVSRLTPSAHLKAGNGWENPDFPAFVRREELARIAD